MDFYRHRVYAPLLGRFCSRDPAWYEGGINCYLYVSADPLGKLDPHGLEWTVDRNGGVQAKAACCDDTVLQLAEMIGLNAHQYRKWLLSADGQPLPMAVTQRMAGRKFLIPNTVIAYWAGWGGAGGQALVNWNASVNWLSSLGFNTIEYDHVAENIYGLARILRASADSKSLHGLYFWGHGRERFPSTGLLADGNWYGTWDPLLQYATLKLPYRMALGLIFACDSNSGKIDLSSNSPGSIWHGYTGTLYLVGFLVGEGYYHVGKYIKHGDQETK